MQRSFCRAGPGRSPSPLARGAAVGPGLGNGSRFPKETLRPRSLDLLGAAELRMGSLWDSLDPLPLLLPPMSHRVLRHQRQSPPRRSNREVGVSSRPLDPFPNPGPAAAPSKYRARMIDPFRFDSSVIKKTSRFRNVAWKERLRGQGVFSKPMVVGGRVLGKNG
jgi:hypothetical protein